MTDQITLPPTQKKHILIIEDDTNVQSIYTDLLSKEGYEVSVTNTVDKACAFLSKQKVDIVLLDIMLPNGKNGFDFLELAKKQNLLKDTPVVVLSNLDEDKSAIKDMGVTTWLVKSNVSSQNVIATIHETVQ